MEADIRRLYREIELAVRQATLLLGHDGTVVDSTKAEHILGLDEGDLLGGPPLPASWSMFDQDGAPVPLDQHPALVALTTGESAERILAYVDPSGSDPRLLRFVAHPVADDPDVAVDVVISDHDRRRQTRVAIESQEARFRTLADMVPVAIYEASPAGEVTYVNPTFTALTGLTVATTPDLPILDIVHPDDLLSVMEAATRAPEEGEYAAQYRVRHCDGSSRWVRSTLSLLIDADGQMAGFVGAIEDIDDLHRAERDANRLAAIVESAGDAVAVFEEERLVYLNVAASVLLTRIGLPSAAEPRSQVSPDQLMGGHRQEIDRALAADARWIGEIHLSEADGDGGVDLSLTVTAEVDEGGRVGRTVVQARDIRDQKRREAELAHDATHDALTGLADRSRLEESVRSTEGAVSAAALFIDIDHFKRINDDHGHAVGDGVLVEVADRLVAAVRPSDVVARVGGDEIVVWATDTTHEQAGVLAARLVAAVNANPVEIGDRSHRITVTIGVAAGRGSDESVLIRRADAALYRAKQMGRNRWLLAVEPTEPDPRAGSQPT